MILIFHPRKSNKKKDLATVNVTVRRSRDGKQGNGHSRRGQIHSELPHLRTHRSGDSVSAAGQGLDCNLGESGSCCNDNSDSLVGMSK